MMVGKNFFQKYCERAEFSDTNIKIVGSCVLAFYLYFFDNSFFLEARCQSHFGNEEANEAKQEFAWPSDCLPPSCFGLS